MRDYNTINAVHFWKIGWITLVVGADSRIVPHRVMILSALKKCGKSMGDHLVVVLQRTNDLLNLFFCLVILAPVASSRMRISGFLAKARARMIRCRCPVEKWTPCSPTSVSRPFGSSAINLSTEDIFTARSISSSLIVSSKKRIFCLMVSLRRKISCGTYPIFFLHETSSTCSAGTPSRRRRPDVGVIKRNKRSTIVVFPDPDRPIILSLLPGWFEGWCWR